MDLHGVLDHEVEAHVDCEAVRKRSVRGDLHAVRKAWGEVVDEIFGAWLVALADQPAGIRKLGRNVTGRAKTCYISRFAGGVPEWLKGADCKSVGLRLRWFESSLLHQAPRVGPRRSEDEFVFEQ